MEKIDYLIEYLVKENEAININELYVRFIEENLYASTNKDKEFSRYMNHGDKIEFGNMKSAMNMIFIYLGIILNSL